MPITDKKLYQPFEDCKGLRKKIDRAEGGWHDPMPDENISYAYYVSGFNNVMIFYDRSNDKVIWAQGMNPGGLMIKKKGVRIWESMRPETQKLFLFNIDWFLGN